MVEMAATSTASIFMLWKCMNGLPFCESWWDLWAASYDAPGWDAKEKKLARLLDAASDTEKTNKYQERRRLWSIFPGSCELVGAVEFEIVAARVHAIGACGRGGDDLQRNGPL